MRWFVRRSTVVVAVAFIGMAVAATATPGVSSAECDRNMSWNRTTGECRVPPAPPDWYRPPPPYAPSFAGQDVPPPPPRPWWSPNEPMWSVRFHQWGTYIAGTWVPF
ncbi:hypothetical protein BB734_01800 [Mycobacterium avium subsp. hominissuis]|uniref:Secreted protein antigen n=2 Tax=Mycobacterium avium TaxID=1764 RepID=A0A2A3LA43_MYCAV|nr:hypothetical protein [Mycobacterium avium]MBZ4611160.1 hypothetical protein [Mycobacterium avium subsp. hominissuis]PBA27660.1 hypothetical protein CKJ66_05620 [Mycobacterium avium]PBA42750.1 hypothetical protein CKJ63_04085 [Mycobacterium avium]PBA47462.1 hypothetical protein CKJ62_04025 [Mycobacterium avium]